MKRPAVMGVGLALIGASLAVVSANPKLGIPLGLAGIALLFLCGG